MCEVCWIDLDCLFVRYFVDQLRKCSKEEQGYGMVASDARLRRRAGTFGSFYVGPRLHNVNTIARGGASSVNPFWLSTIAVSTMNLLVVLVYS
jgi:hypothetical protein